MIPKKFKSLIRILVYIFQIATVGGVGQVGNWDLLEQTKLRFYTQKHIPTSYVEATVNELQPNSDLLKYNHIGLHKDAKTIFIIHGFLASVEENKKENKRKIKLFRADAKEKCWVLEAKEKLLHLAKENEANINVVTVDWKQDAKGNMCQLFGDNFIGFPEAAENTQILAIQIANFLEYLVKEKFVEAKNIHLVGHSLGAHAAGAASRLFSSVMEDEKIGRLTGLDPAQPAFQTPLGEWKCIAIAEHSLRLSSFFKKKIENPKLLNPISSADADFVDIIHTSVLGMNISVGHVDFFPNGGNDMPGCIEESGPSALLSMYQTGENKEICNHSMANRYWVESIASKSNFKAYQCRDYNHFNNGDCVSPKANMTKMGYHIDTDLIGTKSFPKYYLNTIRNKPYYKPNKN